MNSDVIEVVLGILSLAIAVLGGMFKVAFSQIRQVQLDTATGISELQKKIDAQSGDLQRRIDTQSGDHRQGQQQLWSELRLNETRATEHRTRLQERLSDIPTREEMRQHLTEIKQVLTVMENRLVGVMAHNHELSQGD